MYLMYVNVKDRERDRLTDRKTDRERERERVWDGDKKKCKLTLLLLGLINGLAGNAPLLQFR